MRIAIARDDTLTSCSTMRPSRGITWNARWLLAIDYTRKHYDNPQKYIDYIIVARRRAGLPELVE